MSDGKQAPQNGVTYADAGVDISAGNALVEAIKPLARATRRKGTDSAWAGLAGSLTSRPAATRTRCWWPQ